jgi:hypothetical protein
MMARWKAGQVVLAVSAGLLVPVVVIFCAEILSLLFFGSGALMKKIPALLLADLSNLFSLEALEADRNGDADEAERLWDVSDELFEASVSAKRLESAS